MDGSSKESSANGSSKASSADGSSKAGPADIKQLIGVRSPTGAVARRSRASVSQRSTLRNESSVGASANKQGPSSSLAFVSQPDSDADDSSFIDDEPVGKFLQNESLQDDPTYIASLEEARAIAKQMEDIVNQNSGLSFSEWFLDSDLDPDRLAIGKGNDATEFVKFFNQIVELKKAQAIKTNADLFDSLLSKRVLDPVILHYLIEKNNNLLQEFFSLKEKLEFLELETQEIDSHKESLSKDNEALKEDLRKATASLEKEGFSAYTVAKIEEQEREIIALRLQSQSISALESTNNDLLNENHGLRGAVETRIRGIREEYDSAAQERDREFVLLQESEKSSRVRNEELNSQNRSLKSNLDTKAAELAQLKERHQEELGKKSIKSREELEAQRDLNREISEKLELLNEENSKLKAYSAELQLQNRDLQQKYKSQEEDNKVKVAALEIKVKELEAKLSEVNSKMNRASIDSSDESENESDSQREQYDDDSAPLAKKESARVNELKNIKGELENSISVLQADLRELEVRRSVLLKEMEDARQSAQNDGSEDVGGTRKLSALQESLDRVRLEKEEFERKNESLMARIKALEDVELGNEDLRNQLASLRDQLDEAKRATKIVVSQPEDVKIREMQESIIVALKEMVGALESEAENNESLIANQEAALSELKAKSIKLQLELQQLNQSKLDLEAQLRLMKNADAELAQRLRELALENQRKDEESNAAKKSLEVKEVVIEDLSSKAKRDKVHLESLQAELRNKNTELNKLINERDGLLTKNEELQVAMSQFSILQQAKLSDDTAHKRLTEDYQSLTLELNKKNASLDELKADIADLKKQLHDSEEKTKSNLQEVGRLKSELDRLNGVAAISNPTTSNSDEKAKLEKNLTDLMFSQQALEVEHAKITAKLLASEEKELALQRDVGNYKKIINALEENLAENNDRLQDLGRKYEGLKNVLVPLEDEVNKLRQGNKDLISERDFLSIRNGELQAIIDKLVNSSEGISDLASVTEAAQADQLKKSGTPSVSSSSQSSQTDHESSSSGTDVQEDISIDQLSIGQVLNGDARDEAALIEINGLRAIIKKLEEQISSLNNDDSGSFQSDDSSFSADSYPGIVTGLGASAMAKSKASRDFSDQTDISVESGDSELDAFQKDLFEVQGGGSEADNQALKTENDRLKAENDRLKAENDRLKAENDRLKAENQGGEVKISDQVKSGVAVTKQQATVSSQANDELTGVVAVTKQQATVSSQANDELTGGVRSLITTSAFPIQSLDILDLDQGLADFKANIDNKAPAGDKYEDLSAQGQSKPKDKDEHSQTTRKPSSLNSAPNREKLDDALSKASAIVYRKNNEYLTNSYGAAFSNKTAAHKERCKDSVARTCSSALKKIKNQLKIEVDSGELMISGNIDMDLFNLFNPNAIFIKNKAEKKEVDTGNLQDIKKKLAMMNDSGVNEAIERLIGLVDRYGIHIASKETSGYSEEVKDAERQISKMIKGEPGSRSVLVEAAERYNSLVLDHSEFSCLLAFGSALKGKSVDSNLMDYIDKSMINKDSMKEALEDPRIVEAIESSKKNIDDIGLDNVLQYVEGVENKSRPSSKVREAVASRVSFSAAERSAAG